MEEVRLVLNSLPHCAFILDEDGRITFANKPLCDLCENDGIEMIGKGLADIAGYFGFQMENLNSGSGDNVHRCERMSAEGLRKTFELSLIPMSGRDQSLKRMIGSIRDVTDGVKSERLMKKYAEGLTLLYELSALFLNARGIKDALDKALIMIEGYYDADYTHVLFPDDDNRNLRIFAGSGGKPDSNASVIPISPGEQAGATLLDGCPAIVMDYDKELRYTLPEFYADLGVKSGMSVPMSADGHVIGVLCIFYREPKEIDTAGLWYLNVVSNSLAVYIEKERSVEKLEKSEAFLSSVLEGIGEGVVVIDRDYNIISANNSYYEQIKYSPEDAKGKKCHLLSHHLGVPCFERGHVCAVKKVFDTGNAHKDIHTHLDRDNVAVYVETHAYPICDAAGNLTAAVETITNVTDKVRLEKDIEKRVRELEDFYDMAVGRELKMIELKEEVSRLKEQLGKLSGE